MLLKNILYLEVIKHFKNFSNALFNKMFSYIPGLGIEYKEY